MIATSRAPIDHAQKNTGPSRVTSRPTEAKTGPAGSR